MERVKQQRSSRNIFGNKRKKSSIQKGHSSSVTLSEHSFVNKLNEGDEKKIDSDEVVSIFLGDGSLNTKALQTLQDDIYVRGDLLLKNPRIDYVILYRKSVQRLLKSVVPYLHKKEIIDGQKRIITEDGPSLKRYKYTIVAKINTQLEEVVKIIHSTQEDQIQLMAALDEMRGLIVDLLQ